ncbi:MAG: hypothetical protein QHH06_00620 [Clostridiales bacterium]|nr:hypothetical protein [Eubacteriales bacterium]MDH7564973.1 hypothetical protein [Clostridiales bacterium]
MSRQAAPHEKVIFEILKDYSTRFYYEEISKVIEDEQYKIVLEKEKEEMVGCAYVILHTGERIDYEIRYNRIVNTNEGYTLLVPGSKTG